MKKLLYGLLPLVFLASCATVKKDPAPVLEDHGEILANIRRVMPSACEYKGRAVVNYRAQNDDGTEDLATFLVLVDKSCSNDIVVKVLGSFGVVTAELSVYNGQYKIFQKGEELKESAPTELTEEDMVLIEEYLNLPPPLPDDLSLMVHSGDHYMFIREDNTYIFANKDFFVDRVVTGSYQVDYGWTGNRLKSMSFFRDGVSVVVEFSEPWR